MHSGGSGGAALSLELSVGEMGKSIMVFGRKKKLEQQKAEAALLRAFLRQKITECHNAVKLTAPITKFIQESAQEDARPGTASAEETQQRLNEGLEREIGERGLLLATSTLELIIAHYVTKSEIIANIERLASEFSRDAINNATKAKKAWREQKREEFAKAAIVNDHAAQHLNSLLAELFAASH